MNKTLEDKLDGVLEHVQISAALMRQGKDITPPAERLAWMAGLLKDAQAIQARIERRDKKARPS